MNEKRLIVTLLSTNNDYYGGVIGLYYSLQKHNPEIPFCVIVLEDIKDEILQILSCHGIQYKRFPRIDFDNVNENYLHTTFNKFYALMFDEYDKVLFIDADILVSNDISYYFNFEIPDYILTSKLPTNYVSNAVGLYKPNAEYFHYLVQNIHYGGDDENLLTNLYGDKWEARNIGLPMLYVDFEAYRNYIYPAIIHQFGPDKYWRKGKFNHQTIKIFAQNFPELLLINDLEPNCSEGLKIYNSNI